MAHFESRIARLNIAVVWIDFKSGVGGDLPEEGLMR